MKTIGIFLLGMAFGGSALKLFDKPIVLQSTPSHSNIDQTLNNFQQVDFVTISYSLLTTKAGFQPRWTATVKVIASDFPDSLVVQDDNPVELFLQIEDCIRVLTTNDKGEKLY